MKRILFVTPYYAPNIMGGAEISTQLIAEGFPKQVEILTMSDRDESYQYNGVRVNCVRFRGADRVWRKILEHEELSVGDRIFNNLFAILPWKTLSHRYASIIRDRSIDTVVINSNIETMGRASVWHACKLCGVRSILVLRDPILLSKQVLGIQIDKLYQCIIRRQMRDVSAIAAPTQYMIDLYKANGIQKEDSIVLPNAVETEFREAEFEQKENSVLYAGSIRREKGILTLLMAMERLYQKNSRIKLYLFGCGELETECQNYPFVCLNPWIEREKLYVEMRRQKVVVLPSEWPEAFGRILIEGVAQGTLALGSNAGGIPEVFDGEQKYLFESGDVNDLSMKLERIFSLRSTEYEEEVRALQKRFEKYSYATYLENWGTYLC